MIEIIPNWHPVFVHFPIALLSMATLFFVILHFIQLASLREQIKVLAYWNLWLGTGFAVVTAIAGWFAYNSVTHDTPSHEAMTEHRNWALVTLSLFIIITFWAWRLYKSEKAIPVIFILAMLVASSLLVSTAWHGGEIVYRHGLGVMSLPKVEGEGHDHQHHESMSPETVPHEHDKVAPVDTTPTHDHSQHDHAH